MVAVFFHRAKDKSIPGEVLLCTPLLSRGAWWIPEERLSSQNIYQKVYGSFRKTVLWENEAQMVVFIC